MAQELELGDGHNMEVELMHGFSHILIVSPSHLLHFHNFLSFVLLVAYVLSNSFRCINLPRVHFQALPRYEEVWVPKPNQPTVS